MAVLWEPINGVYTATAPLFPWVASLPSFDVGDWGSAVISAGFGAGVGAWMAGRIAQNAKLREELLSEFRSVDVAITLCVSIVDVVGGLKKQIVLPLLSKHEYDLHRFDTYQMYNSGAGPFTLNIDHKTFQAVAPPVNELQELVLKSTKTSPNGLKSMVAMIDAIGSLNEMIKSYNSLIEMFHHGGLQPGFTARDYYLELPVNGVVNQQYGTTIRGIADCTNHVLFFANKLGGCLTARGVKVRDHYEKLSGERYLVRRANSYANDPGLIPPDEDYKGWMRGWEADFSGAVVKRRSWKFWRK